MSQLHNDMEEKTMNYVKHLSVALLVLAVAPMFAAGERKYGYKTPGGTAMVYDEAGKQWNVPTKYQATHTLAQGATAVDAPTLEINAVAPVGKVDAVEDNLTVNDLAAGDVTTPGGTALAFDNASKEFSFNAGHRDGFALDNAKNPTKATKPEVPEVKKVDKADIALTAFDKPFSDSAREFFDKHWTQAGGVKRAAYFAALGAAGFGLYKTVKPFQDAVDGAIESTQEFFSDLKDGKEEAKKKAMIIAGITAAVGAGYYFDLHGKAWGYATS